MPRSKRNRRKSKKPQTVGDVTINEYANSPTGDHSRLKKASESISSQNLTNNVIQEEESIEPEIDNDTSIKTEDNGKKGKQKVVHRSEEKSQRDIGVDYPLDFWFLISEYVRPEDVGIFASICRKTYYVTKSAKFWNRIYNRYCLIHCCRQEKLPRYGLRATVIRKLHQRYFPVLRGNNLCLQQPDPHSLVKRQCVLMWHKEGEERWNYYFKLKEMRTKTETPDVIFNPEEGCKVLRLTCLKYGMVPLAIGLILQSVSVNLSPGFVHHQVKLTFDHTSNLQGGMNNVVILTGVVRIQVLEWWQPSYPFQPIQHHPVSLPPTIDSWDQI